MKKETDREREGGKRERGIREGRKKRRREIEADDERDRRRKRRME